MCVAFFLGKKGNVKDKIPRKSQDKAGTVPGQSRDSPGTICEKVVYVFVVYCFPKDPVILKVLRS